MLRHFLTGMFSAALLVVGANPVSGQPYPHRPIRVVTAEVGGAADIALRIITPSLAASLGQPVIVENRISGVIPPDTVAKAQPDGYTLLLYSNGVWILPLMQKAPYDPVNDFAPLTLTMRSPSFLVAHPTLPVNSVKELIALAKAKPGQLNYGSGGTGGAGHLAAELFKAMTGVDIVRIPYKGGGPALNDLLGGQIQLGFLSSASVSPHMKSGRLKTLASTGAQPFALFPDVPTIAASGVPGYESEQLLGMFAPAKTPAPLVSRLSEEIVQALKRPEVKERLAAVGVETGGNTPAQFAALIKSEITRMGKVIKDAGIRAE